MSETSDSSISSEDSEKLKFSEIFENSESSKLTKFSEQTGGGTPDRLHRGGHCYWWVLAYTHTGDFEIETGFRFSLTPHPFALWTRGTIFVKKLNMSKIPVEKGDVYKDKDGISVVVAELHPSELSVTITGVKPGSTIKRLVTLETLELEYTKVPTVVKAIPPIPKDQMAKFNAYNELIDICSKQVMSLLGMSAEAFHGTSADLNTITVDDDDNIHLVIHNHKNAPSIAARLEIINELKKTRQV